MSYTKPQFEIGSIVSFLLNPYTDIDIEKIPDASDEIISIQSDSDFIPPFMVVIEVAKIPGKDSEKYDTETGFEQVKGYSCKCIYFNSLTKTFEEKWFPEKFLKSYKIPELISEAFISVESDTNPNDYLGKKVILKTWKLESAKRKAYLKVDSKSLDSNNQVTTALLKHLPPVMTVIGFMKPKEVNNTAFDKATGNNYKKHSIHLLKCQWYNPKTGGFSENVVPLEALSRVPEVNEKVLELVKRIIQSKNEYLKLQRSNTQINALPLRVVYNHCEHILIYEDLITGKNNSMPLSYIKENQNRGDLSSEYAPSLEEGKYPSREELIESIKVFIEEDNLYYRLVYIDNHYRVTSRTISNIRPIISQDGQYSDKYILAHCHLRDDQRTFLMDNILKITKLFPIDNTPIAPPEEVSESN